MVLTNGLISYYKLDEISGNAIDAHGSNDGTMVRGPTQGVLGKIGNAIDLLGDDEYINIANQLNVSSAGSWSYWVYLDTLGSKTHISKREAWVVNDWQLGNNDVNGNFYVFLWGLSAESHNTGAEFLTTGSWIHIVVTYDGSHVRIYKNGLLHTGPTAATGNINNNNVSTRIGDDFFGNNMDGRIDELGFWNRGLSADEVNSLWANGNGLPYPFEVLPPPPTEGFLEILGITAPTSAHEGDTINFTVHTKNTGDADNFKVEIAGIQGEIFEGFETGFVEWKNVIGDDFDWTRKSGSTSSSSTGPSAAYEGNYYAYTESSSPNYPDKISYLESPEINSILGLSFNYHMYGNTMGTLSLEISEYPYSVWTPVWSISGDQGNAWYLTNIDLSAYSGQTVKLRFKGQVGSLYRSDMAIDNISILTTLGSEFSLGAGLTKDVPFSFIMPLNDVSIIINTYHLTEEGDWVWDVSSVWDVNRWF